MFQLLNKITRNYSTIGYKLLNDLLWLCLVFLFFMLIGESLLPGSISSGMKFPIVIVVIALISILIEILAKYLNISKEASKNKKSLLIGAVVFAIFILNSLVKLFQFHVLLAIFVFLFILITSYFIYKLAFES